MDASAWQLLLLELALVVVLAVLSAGEAAINIARRPGVIDELSLRGRRGQRYRRCSRSSCGSTRPRSSPTSARSP